MFNSVAVGIRLRERVWGHLFKAAGELRATTPPVVPANDRVGPLPATGPGDLGLRADRAGSLGIAKGPYQGDV